jgi:putative ABC transport system ATP-binding protein
VSIEALRTEGLGARADEPALGRLMDVRDVFKIYKEGETETVALRGASLGLDEGEFVSLVGPSGSGKTTLLWIMAGLTIPAAGRVIFQGQDLTRMDEAERARVRAGNIGLVFQRGNLIPFLNAEENVAMAVKLARGKKPTRKARELLAGLGLEDRRRHYPRQLSGGEAQRVAIALALANDPVLLLGDEITGELDSVTSARVLEVLLGVQRQRAMTVLTVTHNPWLASQAGRQLHIADGVLVSS